MNNLTWTVDTIDHFCLDGKPIKSEEHAFRYLVCGSQWMHKLLVLFTYVKNYHLGILADLSLSLVSIHDFLGEPEQFYENIKIAEKNYRDNLDVKHQFIVT